MQEPDRGWVQGPVRVWRPQSHYVWRRALDWCMSPGRPHTDRAGERQRAPGRACSLPSSRSSAAGTIRHAGLNAVATHLSALLDCGPVKMRLLPVSVRQHRPGPPWALGKG